MSAAGNTILRSHDQTSDAYVRWNILVRRLYFAAKTDESEIEWKAREADDVIIMNFFLYKTCRPRGYKINFAIVF